MAQYLQALVDSYLPEESEGQGMVEYALILALISIAAITVLLLFGPQITSILNRVVAALTVA